MILAGDIGGTNSRLALFTGSAAKPEIVALEVFPSAHHQSLAEVVRLFRQRHPDSIKAACFGVAGPVVAGTAKLPNLDWETIDANRLSIDLGVSPVHLANDLEVNAYGIAVLTPDDLVTLNVGAPDAKGNRVLISAGTGLGEAGLLFDNDEYEPWACEGGHCDFAPRNETEIALLQYLLKQFDHVSYERVLSGPGLHNIYLFLRDSGRATERQDIVQRFSNADASAIISEAGLKGEDQLSVAALDLFVSIYGAEAGNLALKGLATGGVYIGGGIPPEILPKLLSPQFHHAFTTKGRSSHLMESMPVHVILNDKTALLGAGRLAMLGR